MKMRNAARFRLPIGNRGNRRWLGDKPAKEVRPHLQEEMAPTLSHMEPEIRNRIEVLAATGRQVEAEQELLEYVVNEDHSSQISRAVRPIVVRDERVLDKRLYLVAFIPTVIALYFIFQVLTTGHFKL